MKCVLEIGVFVDVVQKFEKHLFVRYIIIHIYLFLRSSLHGTISVPHNTIPVSSMSSNAIFRLSSYFVLLIHFVLFNSSVVVSLALYCMCGIVCIKNPVSIWTFSSPTYIHIHIHNTKLMIHVFVWLLVRFPRDIYTCVCV